MNTPECYIVERNKAPIPARVVKETKSTVTVEVTYPGSGITVTKTFNKRKRCGGDWRDPRTDNDSYGLDERGSGHWSTVRLRFDVSNVEAEREEEKKEDYRSALRKVMVKGTDVEGTLIKANVPTDSTLYGVWVQFKAALQDEYRNAGGV